MSGQRERPVETPRGWLRYTKGDLGVAEQKCSTRCRHIIRSAFFARAQRKSLERLLDRARMDVGETEKRL